MILLKEPFVIGGKLKKIKRIKAAFNFHYSPHPFLYCIIKCIYRLSLEVGRHIRFKLLFHTGH